MPTTKPQDNVPSIMSNSYTFIINNTYVMPISINLSRENSGDNPSSGSPQAETLPRNTKEEPEHIEFNPSNSVPVAQYSKIQTQGFATSISSYLTLIVPPGPRFKPTPQIIPELAPIFSLEELNLLEEKSRTVRQESTPDQVPPSPMFQSTPQSTPQEFLDLFSISSEEELKLREALIEPQNFATKSKFHPRNRRPKCPLAKMDGTVLATIFEDSDKVEPLMMRDVLKTCARPQLKDTSGPIVGSHAREELKPMAKTVAVEPIRRPRLKITTLKNKPVKQAPLKSEINKLTDRERLLINTALRGSGVVIYESIIKAYNFLKDNDRKNFCLYTQLFKNHMKGYEVFEDRFSIISNLVQEQYDNERETTDCCLSFFAKKSNKVSDFNNTTLTTKFVRLFLNIDALFTTADIALAFEENINALIASNDANYQHKRAKV